MVGNKLKVRDFINIEPCNQINFKGNLIKLLSCKDLDFKGFGDHLTSIKYGQKKVGKALKDVFNIVW